MKAAYKILNPKFFIKHSEVIASFLYEGVMQFSDEIRLVGIDPGRIAVLELKLGNDLVETTNKTKLEAPINLDDFSKITKRFSDPEELTISFDDFDNIVTIKGKIKNKTKTFRLSTIDMDMTDFKDPIPMLSKIKYNVVFKISSGDLLDALKDTELYSDIFTISTDNGLVIISATGIIGSSKTEIEPITEIYAKEKSSYSTGRTKKILTPLKGSDVLVMLKKDYPLALYDRLSAKSHMLYYLAPRIDEEEDDDD